jgi:undecaprenyl-diphosphatase
VAGLLGDDFVEGAFHQSSAPHGLTAMMAIGLLMIGLGLLLWVAERRAAHRRDLGALRLPDAILVGCAQALAILPGVSRSGATITMGLALGMQRPVAARFSFLLAAPIVAGAGLKKVYDAVKVGLSGHDALILIVGVASAALVGYLCIRFLLRYLQSRTTDVFVYYRFCAGLAIIALAWARG